MKVLPVSQLQNVLNYEFRHIIFLEEALTHSIDTCSTNKSAYDRSQLQFEAQTNSRLKLLGSFVLKMVALEYAMNMVPKPGNDNELTLLLISGQLLEPNILEMIGDDLGLEDFLEVSEKEKCSDDYDEEKLFPGLIQAIFGAIYMDSQMGPTSAGLRICYGVFLWLWKGYCEIETPDNFKKEDYQNVNLGPSHKNFFRPPSSNVDVIKVLKREMDSEEFNPAGIDYLQSTCLNYKFKNSRLLIEALTHESVECVHTELKGIRDMKSLQIVGRAVYELSIAEYLLWTSMGNSTNKNSTPDPESLVFSQETMEKFTCDKFKSLISLGLALSGYVLRSPEMKYIRNDHEYLEALVGAVYVDSKEERDFGFVSILVITFTNNIQIYAKPTLGYCLPPEMKRKCWAYDANVTSDKNKLSSIRYYHNISLNLDRFLHHWEEYAVSAHAHFQNFQQALDMEWNIKKKHHKDYLSMDLFNAVLLNDLTEGMCNKLEFERFSVYNIAARMHIEQGKGNKVKTFSVSIEDILKKESNPRKNPKKERKREWLQWKSTIGDTLNAEKKNEDFNNLAEVECASSNTSKFSSISSLYIYVRHTWFQAFKYWLFKKPALEIICVVLLAALIFALMVWIKPPVKKNF